MKISQKLVAIALCACMYAPTQTYAYSERNILQKEFVADSLRAYLVPGQKWVKYPAYATGQAGTTFSDRIRRRSSRTVRNF